MLPFFLIIYSHLQSVDLAAQQSYYLVICDASDFCSTVEIRQLSQKDVASHFVYKYLSMSTMTSFETKT